MRIGGILLTAIVCALPAMAVAQETRAETIAAEQAEKATHLEPYQPSKIETLLTGLRLGEQPAGFYPYLDSVYNGGGFTLGGGYRYYLGDRTHLSMAGLYSVKGYKLVEATVTSPGHMSGHLDLRSQVVWLDATQVNYYGLGIDSAKDDHTNFRMQQALVGGDATLRLLRWVRLTGAVSYEDFTLKDPTGGLPPVDDRFTPATAPGLGVNPVYLHSTASAAFDWRPADDYARRGGIYSIAGHHYADRDNTYSFDRLETELVQHFPILRENWVVSLRGRLQSTLGDSDQVPYFLLPSLGSGSTLRGYRSWRFRDRYGLLAQGEWRWIPNRMALDMAFFYDAGMVAPRLDALVLRSFVQDVGVGIRFHSATRTPLRIDLAKGSEGFKLSFAANSAF